VLVDEGHLDEGVDGEQRSTHCAVGATQLAKCDGLDEGARVWGGVR
jgi:hypothetical protein